MRSTYSITEKLLLGIYAIWWVYVFYFMYIKAYDNNYAGYISTVAVATITVGMLLLYSFGFLVAMFFTTKKKRLYLITVFYIILPAIIAVWTEYMRQAPQH